MSKIKIITDSTADLPREFTDAHGIGVVPLYVNFSNATYRDGIDIMPRDFYPMLNKAGSQLPKTSMPTLDDFMKIYENMIKDGYEILSIHISSSLSGTPKIAESAAKFFAGKVHVFDSKSISLGIGLQVQEALDMLKENLSMENILDRLAEVRSRTEVLFSLDTLEYLEKGGRIGKVSALLGSLLSIKPVVRVENGIYVPIDKVRNQKQAILKMVEHAQRILAGKVPRHIAVAHGAAYEAALFLKQHVEETLGKKVSLLQEVGPVVGVHTGPGTIGLCFTY